MADLQGKNLVAGEVVALNIVYGEMVILDHIWAARGTLQ